MEYNKRTKIFIHLNLYLEDKENILIKLGDEKNANQMNN